VTPETGSPPRLQRHPLRALLVEDSGADATLVLRELQRGGFDVVFRRVETAPAFEAALAEPWDVVISDFQVPGFTGQQALEVLQKRALEIPLVLVSGTIGEETAVEMLLAGARDYILKDRLARLPSAVARVLLEIEQSRERRRAEAELRESETRYRALFDSNPQPMWVYDLETLSFLAVNDAAVSQHGYSAAEFLSMTIRDVRPAEAERTGPRRHRRKDGSYFLVEVSSQDFRFRGRAARLDLSIDVTQRVRLEEQLRQAQKMEAVGRLASGVSHDFNNVLTAILGYSELALGKLGVDAAVRDDLVEIHRAGERALALTRQLLAFGSKQNVSPQLLKPVEVIADLSSMLRRLISARIRIETVLCENAGAVRADRGQIEQVLVNLVVNARDAMPEGGTITIGVANADVAPSQRQAENDVAPGAYVKLSVSDTGTGMTTETLRHLFEPFYTTKEEGKGTGLGLSTVYGIVKQSGGSIRVESELSRGTQFEIYLPRVEPEASRAL